MIYEIRNYHFEPSRFEAYKDWARERALPFLSRELDLVGFWATLDGPSEVNGEPMDSMGSSNLTWIIRWPDRETRDAKMGTIFTTDAWNEIFNHVPGGVGSYLRTEAKFAEQLD